MAMDGGQSQSHPNEADGETTMMISTYTDGRVFTLQQATGTEKNRHSINTNEPAEIDKYGSPPHSIEISSIIILPSQLDSLSIHSIT
jgi:hypothetical protein